MIEMINVHKVEVSTRWLGKQVISNYEGIIELFVSITIQFSPTPKTYPLVCAASAPSDLSTSTPANSASSVDFPQARPVPLSAVFFFSQMSENNKKKEIWKEPLPR